MIEIINQNVEKLIVLVNSNYLLFVRYIYIYIYIYYIYIYKYIYIYIYIYIYEGHLSLQDILIISKVILLLN